MWSSGGGSPFPSDTGNAKGTKSAAASKSSSPIYSRAIEVIPAGRTLQARHVGLKSHYQERGYVRCAATRICRVCSTGGVLPVLLVISQAQRTHLKALLKDGIANMRHLAIYLVIYWARIGAGTGKRDSRSNASHAVGFIIGQRQVFLGVLTRTLLRRKTIFWRVRRKFEAPA